MPTKTAFQVQLGSVTVDVTLEANAENIDQEAQALLKLDSILKVEGVVSVSRSEPQTPQTGTKRRRSALMDDDSNGQTEAGSAAPTIKPESETAPPPHDRPTLPILSFSISTRTDRTTVDAGVPSLLNSASPYQLRDAGQSSNESSRVEDVEDDENDSRTLRIVGLPAGFTLEELREMLPGHHNQKIEKMSGPHQSRTGDTYIKVLMSSPEEANAAVKGWSGEKLLDERRKVYRGW